MDDVIARTGPAGTVDYALQLLNKEGYNRKILGIQHSAEVPEGAVCYGDGVTFLCYEATAVLDEDKPIVYRNENVLCGGAVYAGIGNRRLKKQEFADGLEMVVGEQRAYSSKEVMRRVNQQLPHYPQRDKYLVMGAVELMDDPELVMIITDPQHVMRLCKTYTWKTGEVVHAFGGTCWCGMSFPEVFRDKSITFNFGDPPARSFMQLDDSEMFCVIHREVLPLIAENIDKISTGEGY